MTVYPSVMSRRHPWQSLALPARQTFALLLSAGSLAVYLLFLRPALTLSLDDASRLCLVATAVAMVTIFGSAPGRFWSPAGALLVLLALFHSGLTLFSAVGATPSLPNVGDRTWYFTPETAQAFVLVGLGLLAFAAASTAMMASRGRLARTRDERRESRFASAGAIITIGTVALWFLLSASYGGIGIFAANYSTYLRATHDAPLPYVYFGIGLGLSLMSFGRRSAMVVVGAAAFAAFAIAALLLGLRGEVLFPLAGACVVMAPTRRMPRYPVILLAMLLTLTLTSAIKEVRQVGVTNVSVGQLAASPARGIGELGYTIRVVETSVEWHKYDREPYLHGASYAAPVERFTDREVLGRPIVPAQSDDRLMNVEIAQRVGNIGGSMIGEADHNYGASGVLAVLGLVGLIMGFVSSGRQSTTGAALMAVIFVPLVNHVRNSFTPVPVSVLAGLLVILALEFSLRVMPSPEKLGGDRDEGLEALSGGARPPVTSRTATISRG